MFIQRMTLQAPFIGFLFSQRNIDSFLRDEWLRLYDVDYVDNTLIGTLQKYMPEATALSDMLRDRVSGM